MKFYDSILLFIKKLKYRKKKLLCKECGEKCDYVYKMINSLNFRGKEEYIEIRCENCILFEIDNIHNIYLLKHIKTYTLKEENISKLECNNKNCNNINCKYLNYGLCEKCNIF
jgi:hypothetical protein